MLFATVDQGYVFLFMCAAGALVSAWYDVMLIARRALEAGFFLSLLADIALGLGAAALLSVALVAANYGQPRLYAFAAAALGAALYALGAARPLHALLRGLRRLGARMCGGLKKNRIIKVIFR